MWLDLLYLIFSLALLYFGAEWLIKGAASVAVLAGVPPLLVGLTVVAYGTSFPELLVSVQAAINGNSSIAVGNVVGSNIMNIAVILGVGALICPMKVELKLIRIDTPIMIFVSLVAFILLRTGEINRFHGICLLLGAASYTLGSIYFAKRDKAQANAIVGEVPEKTDGWGKSIIFIILGSGILAGGSNLLVYSAVNIAHAFEVKEVFIGLTIVAFGTSVPELVTSVVAALRKESDIAIGNVVGSNIFNILFILGAASVITPIETTSLSSLDLFTMMTTAILLLPIAWSGKIVSRNEGFVLLSIYGLYLFLIWPQ